jgi:hypothetical protein
VGLVCAAIGVVGVSFGAIAVSAGLPVWLPVALSLLVFAGASQFVFVGLLLAGGGVVGARAPPRRVKPPPQPVGVGVGDQRGWGRGGWVLGSPQIIDE